MKILSSFHAGLLLLGLSATAQAADAMRAHYDLYYYGAQAGEVTVTLTREAAHTYYQVVAKPNWVARLAGQGVITERGTMTSSDLRPTEYYYHDTGSDRHYKYLYNWPQQQVLITSHKGESIEPLTEGTLDPAAMAVLMLRDLPRRLSSNYSVLSRGVRKVYRFDRPALENLKVLGQEQLVWKATRIRDSATDSRVITWHDPANGQWMVRTVRIEDGEEKVRLELTELERE